MEDMLAQHHTLMKLTMAFVNYMSALGIDTDTLSLRCLLFFTATVHWEILNS